MPTPNDRIAGVLFVQLDGDPLLVRANWEYNLGKPRRESMVGLDSVHGVKETPQVPYIQGDVTYGRDLDVEALLEAANATVSIDLPNGKTLVFRNATQAAEGTANPEEGTVSIRFEAQTAEVV